MRPPDSLTAHQAGASTGVAVFKEESEDSDDDVNIVQEEYVQPEVLGAAPGALVSDMFKVKDAADQASHGSESAPNALQIEGGINLGRAQRKKRGSVVRTDLSQLRGAVEALVQGVTPLARCMEHLQVCPYGRSPCVLPLTGLRVHTYISTHNVGLSRFIPRLVSCSTMLSQHAYPTPTKKSLSLDKALFGGLQSDGHHRLMPEM